jgi:hypothetical protein
MLKCPAPRPLDNVLDREIREAAVEINNSVPPRRNGRLRAKKINPTSYLCILMDASASASAQLEPLYQS